MLKFGYVAMLTFTVVGSFWLEIVLKIRVLKRIKRALMSIIPIAILFLIWDAYAVASGHWKFDPEQILKSTLTPKKDSNFTFSEFIMLSIEVFPLVDKLEL